MDQVEELKSVHQKSFCEVLLLVVALEIPDVPDTPDAVLEGASISITNQLIRQQLDKIRVDKLEIFVEVAGVEDRIGSSHVGHIVDGLHCLKCSLRPCCILALELNVLHPWLSYRRQLVENFFTYLQLFLFFLPQTFNDLFLR